MRSHVINFVKDCTEHNSYFRFLLSRVLSAVKITLSLNHGPQYIQNSGHVFLS